MLQRPTSDFPKTTDKSKIGRNLKTVSKYLRKLKRVICGKIYKFHHIHSNIYYSIVLFLL